MDTQLHDYLIKVKSTFIRVAKGMDGEYFNGIDDEKIKVVFASQEVLTCRRARKHLMGDKYKHKFLYTPFELTLYVTQSFTLGNDVYLDAFFVDSSDKETQRVYLLIGNKENYCTIKSYTKIPDGTVMASKSNAAVLDALKEQSGLVSVADSILAGLAHIVSKAKAIKIKSPIGLYELCF